jgi:uncharacterized protein YjaZ
MKINVIFLESERGFKKEEQKKVETIVKTVTKDTIRVLGGDQEYVNITVYPFDVVVKGKSFLAATTMSTEWVQLIIPSDWKEDDLKGTVHHEMHHAVRGSVPYRKEDQNLLDAIFSEGLANTFQIEKVPGYVPDYATYKIEDLQKFFPDLKKEMNNKNYAYYDWFFGEGERWWLGYKMGTYFVDEVFKNNPKITHKKLVHEDAKNLLRLSGVQI